MKTIMFQHDFSQTLGGLMSAQERMSRSRFWFLALVACSAVLYFFFRIAFGSRGEAAEMMETDEEEY